MIPKVSIIIPIWNVEKYLKRCLDSILNQTLEDIEVILVDDESPDNCPQMCDEYAKLDSRVKVIHKKNGGLGLARNSGIEVASGEFITFIDSDDFIELDMMERLYIECKNENLDIIYSEFNVDDYSGFRIVLSPEKLYIGSEQIEELCLDMVGAEPTYISSVKFHCSACKGLYSLDLIRKHNLKFLSERQYISEDLLFNLDLLKFAQKVKTVPWQLYHYCLNGISLTHVYRPDRWQKSLIMIDELDKRSVDFRNKEEFKYRLNRTCLFYARTAIIDNISQHNILLRSKLTAIREIINEKHVRNSLEKYPINKLPIQWQIFAYLLKWKQVIVLYILLKIYS